MGTTIDYTIPFGLIPNLWYFLYSHSYVLASFKIFYFFLINFCIFSLSAMIHFLVSVTLLQKPSNQFLFSLSTIHFSLVTSGFRFLMLSLTSLYLCATTSFSFWDNFTSVSLKTPAECHFQTITFIHKFRWVPMFLLSVIHNG